MYRIQRSTITPPYAQIPTVEEKEGEADGGIFIDDPPALIHQNDVNERCYKLKEMSQTNQIAPLKARVS